MRPGSQQNAIPLPSDSCEPFYTLSCTKSRVVRQCSREFPPPFRGFEVASQYEENHEEANRNANETEKTSMRQ